MPNMRLQIRSISRQGVDGSGLILSECEVVVAHGGGAEAALNCSVLTARGHGVRVLSALAALVSCGCCALA